MCLQGVLQMAGPAVASLLHSGRIVERLVSGCVYPALRHTLCGVAFGLSRVQAVLSRPLGVCNGLGMSS